MNSSAPNARRRGPVIAAVLCATWLATAASGQTYVTPMMGGGQTAADMVHIDLYYDAGANQLAATLDASMGTPMLRPLDPGYAFDPSQPYAVLNAKAYNFQYGWNVGGFFSLPPGSELWVEATSSSSALETYEQGTYTPTFGTGTSSRLWKWPKKMVHNVYAVKNPRVKRMFVDYHLYFGDAETGSRANFMNYGDTTLRLEWDVAPAEDPLTFRFGAVSQTNGAPLWFINGDRFVTNSLAVVNFHSANDGPGKFQYDCSIPMMAVPASSSYGGPAEGAAAPGACLELEFVSLAGPAGASLSFREPGRDQPQFRLPAGATGGTNRVRLSENGGVPGSDPYGCFEGRQLSLNLPGLYCLGLRVVDCSTNGLGAGDIHTPSPIYPVHLQAGLTIVSLARQGSACTASFAGEAGKTFYLERGSALGSSEAWQTVAGPLTGTNELQTLTDPAGTATKGFFRLRAE